MSLTEKKLYMGRRYVNAASGETFETFNAATGATLCRIQQAGPEDMTGPSRGPARV